MIGTQKEQWTVLVRDNNCHWYAVPESELFNFPHWVASCEDCTAWDGFDFEQCRLQGAPEVMKFKDMQPIRIG